jgi:signal transduction histidine kinase/PAS domain-containing protein
MSAIITLMAAGGAALVLAYLTSRRRRSAGTTAFAVLMLSAAVWTIGYALELGQDQLVVAELLAKIQYLGIVTLPSAWLLFALTYTKRRSRIAGSKLLWLMLIEPLITLILAWSYPANRWLWADVSYVVYDTMRVAEFVPGWWYGINVAYSYALLILGSVCMAVHLRSGSHNYRAKMLALITMVSAPWICNLLYIFDLTPWSHIDLTPFGFIIAGAAAAFGLLRYRLLNIVPIARDLVLETMHGAVLIIDAEGFVVDLNRAAGDLLQIRPGREEDRGQYIGDILPGLPDLADAAGQPVTLLGECIWKDDRIFYLGDEVALIPGDHSETTRYFELQIMPISQRGAGFHGHYLLINDISQRVRARTLQRRDTEQLATLVSTRTSEIETTLARLQVEAQERRRVESSLRRQNQQLAALNAVAAILSQELVFPQALVKTLVEIMKLPGVHYAWLHLFPKEPEDQIILAPGGEDLPTKTLEDVLAQDINDVMQTQTTRTILVPIGQIPGYETASMMLVPVRARDSVLGVAMLIWTPDKYSSSHDLSLIEGICHQIGLTVENMRLLANAADIEIWQKLSDLRSELIANVSHEIRTPLGLIKLFATALQLDEMQFDAERRQEFLAGIDEEAENLEVIITDLLNLGQAEKGQMRLDRQLLDLQQLVRHLVSSMRLEFGEHHLVREFSDHPVIVNADEQRLIQVLRNLVTNAIKYSPATGRITVGVQPELDRAVISVADEGIGIPLEDQVHIFERFYRVDNEVTRRTRGTGLGLAISKTIIEAHGGHIWCTSEPRQGSVFSFSLPTVSTAKSTRRAQSERRRSQEGGK